MPYIKQETRNKLDPFVKVLISELERDLFNLGELNYAITKILHAAWDFNTKYETGNALVGVLECVKQEFYRKKLTPYEEKKIAENGDI